MFAKVIKKEIVRMVKRCDDKELLDFVYLIMLKSTCKNLENLQLFDTKNITF